MSLMWKLSLTTALISATLNAASDAEVVAFLKKAIGDNPNIVSLDVEILDKKKLDEPKGWEAYMLELKGTVKAAGQEREVKQGMTYFVNGDIITKELINIKTGRSVADAVAPEFRDTFYTDANRLSGNADAKHKVAVFSDPLCPFCRRFVPEAVEYMKQYPETFAVYYYHFPLPSLHPAAVTLTKAAIAAEVAGTEGVFDVLYKVNVDARESDEKKILAAFNKAMGTDLTPADLKKNAVKERYDHDRKVARAVMVNGTPTVFFDGKKDASKKLYKNVKVK